MRKYALLAATVILGASCAMGAIPTLSSIAEALESIKTGVAERIAETSNRIDEAQAELAEINRRIKIMIEADKGMRERYHGGRIGEYVLSNEVNTAIGPRWVYIHVDLYQDGSVWTNGHVKAINSMLDPEAQKKAIAEAKRKAQEAADAVAKAWEAANLPPDLAALRERQRAARREAEEADRQ